MTLLPEGGIKGRSRMIPAEPFGQGVGRGEAELGFQQLSELKPVAGIDIVGPIPGATQQVTLFSAAAVTGSKHAASARALIRFLASPQAAEARSAGPGWSRSKPRRAEAAARQRAVRRVDRAMVV